MFCYQAKYSVSATRNPDDFDIFSTIPYPLRGIWMILTFFLQYLIRYAECGGYETPIDLPEWETSDSCYNQHQRRTPLL